MLPCKYHSTSKSIHKNSISLGAWGPVCSTLGTTRSLAGMVWELMGDYRNNFIAEAIRRDILEAIIANIHFRINALADQDNSFQSNLT